MIETNNKNNSSFSDDIIVKDADGSFKVLSQGKWQPLGAYRTKTLKPEPSQSLQKKEKVDLGDLAREVAREANLTLQNGFDSRFRMLIDAYLRGVRNSLDTFLVLKRSGEEGGLGLGEEEAEKVLEIINKKKNVLEKDNVSTSVERKAPFLDLSHELAPPPPVISSAKAEGVSALIPEKKKSVFVRPGRTTSGEAERPPAPKEVKFKPKLVGPVEEMRNLTLLDFRRLDKNPEKASEKIRSKIDLLEKESYQKKSEGIAAWRDSELNRIYLEQSALAMEQGKSVAKFIEEKLAKNEKVLTIQEFEALLDLNRELKY